MRKAHFNIIISSMSRPLKWEISRITRILVNIKNFNLFRGFNSHKRAINIETKSLSLSLPFPKF